MKKKKLRPCLLITLPFNILITIFFFSELTEEEKEFVLDYLSSGKGCFPYEVVTGFNSHSAVQLTLLKNLSNFNDVYSIQERIF